MIRKYLYMICMLLGLVAGGCKDEPSAVAEATLTSTRNVSFAAQGAESVMITVTSDGDWSCEVPAWLTVSPSSGHAGQTDVVITAADNMRDGAMDLPREFDLMFGGTAKSSQARVLVTQQGDRYRDLADVTVAKVYDMDDEAAVSLKGLTVVAPTAKGFVATDGTDYMYFTSKDKPARWTKVNVLGVRASDAAKMASVAVERVTNAGSAQPLELVPADITASLSDYSSQRRSPVKLTGVYDGSVIKVAGSKLSVIVDDAAADVSLDQLAGHNVEVQGLYAGTAAPVVKLTLLAAADLGLNETIYFKDDFEWFDVYLKDYRDSKGRAPGNAVTEDNPSAYMPQLTTPKIDGKSLMDEFREHGYMNLGESKAATCGRNYLKLSITDFQGGVTLPAIDAFGDGVKDPVLSFDWTPAKSSAGVYDLSEIVVVVTNGSSSVQIAVPARPQETGAVHRWFREEITLTGVTVNRDTRITLRNVDSQWGNVKGVFRWYLDNIKIYKAN